MQKQGFIIGIISVFLILKGVAQTNLVFNGGFESYTICPTAQNGNVTGWYSSSYTPDYFNGCSSTSTGFSTPNNVFGYQPAYDGQAYCGFDAYNVIGNNRECISSKLANMLVIGQKYFASLRVNLCDAANAASHGINKIGILLSTQQYTPSAPPPVKNYAQVYTNTIITDSVNWTLIKGSFVADSAYQYINVSNFFDIAHTDTSGKNPYSTAAGSMYSYYLVDDVRLSTDSLYGSGYVGIKELGNVESKIGVYPNPAANTLCIESKDENLEGCQVEINNTLGQTVLSLPFTANVDISLLAQGMYTLRITGAQRQVYYSKFIKE